MSAFNKLAAEIQNNLNICESALLLACNKLCSCVSENGEGYFFDVDGKKITAKDLMNDFIYEAINGKERGAE